MGIGDRVSERGSLTQKIIDEIDVLVVSPNERAIHIWGLLKNEHPDLTDWDVLCFAVEYTAMMIHSFPWLEEPAKLTARLLYLAHYMNPEKIDAASVLKRTGKPPESRVPQWNPEGEHEGDSPRITKPRFYTQ